PPRLVTQRLLLFVQSELLRSWSDASPASPLRLLRHLKALEDVRDALDHDAAEQFGAQLGGANGLDFLVQIVHDLRSPLTSILFHPFRRSAKAGRDLFSGTGLGLALTRRLVRAMGSELCLETLPNVGTQFWFDLELPPAQPT